VLTLTQDIKSCQIIQRISFLSKFIHPRTSFLCAGRFSTSIRTYAAKKTPFISLDSLVKVNELEKEDVNKITEVWLEYHKQKPCISAVIPAETYTKMISKATPCPRFVFPVFEGEGFLSFYCQLVNPKYCIFTTLEQYSTKHEHAAQYLKMAYFTEFEKTKKIVLMRGDVDTQFLSTQKAQFLANLWQIFLLDENKYQLMQNFNQKSAQFDFNSVLKEVSSLPSLLP